MLHRSYIKACWEGFVAWRKLYQQHYDAFLYFLTFSQHYIQLSGSVTSVYCYSVAQTLKFTFLSFSLTPRLARASIRPDISLLLLFSYLSAYSMTSLTASSSFTLSLEIRLRIFYKFISVYAPDTCISDYEIVCKFGQYNEPSCCTCSDWAWSLWHVSSCSHSDTSMIEWALMRRDNSPTTVTCFDTVPDIFLNCG